jgi:mycothiol synthase
MQTPFWSVDYACHPNADVKLHQSILAWADDRACIILNTPYGHPTWFVNVFAGEADRIRDLEENGFTSQADVGDNSWSKVFMRRSTQIPLADTILPASFTIRPLAGENEVAGYVELHRAVFESRNMTVEWRARTLRCPEYLPDLDTVATAPDGRLAAFCVCWLDKNAEGETSGQVEPLGVHPDFRKLGLGRAVLSEGLRRLQRHGAQEIVVETDSYRNAAFKLYESCGFSVIKDVLVYRKDI